MKSFIYNQQVQLQAGDILNGIEIAYSTYGKLNEAKDNVVWVCHALSGNSEVHDWWAGIFGEGKVLDPSKSFIVCANVLGSCYGTTGPFHPSTESAKKGVHFPLITIKDMVTAHQLLAEELDIDSIQLLIGPSLGGQQAVEWAVDEPTRIRRLVLVATNAQHSPWGIAFNESQRMTLWADETFRSNTENGGKFGLKAARSIAMLSYRSYEGYGITQREDFNEKSNQFKASSYQQYQGDKFVKRFDAFSYWSLSQSMDSHNVGRNRGGVIDALSKIQAKTLVLGIESDLLFPIQEQEFLAKNIDNSYLKKIKSHFGHDGFLTENELVNQLIVDFIENDFSSFKQTEFRKKIAL